MSNRTVEQVKDLIISDLSLVEKAQLIEWLGAGLRQELAPDSGVASTHSVEPVEHSEETAHRNGVEFHAATLWPWDCLRAMVMAVSSIMSS